MAQSPNQEDDQLQKLESKNIFQSSELVIKYFIDKLIASSVKESYIHSVEKKIGSYCFSFLENQVNQMFQEAFIFHSTAEGNKLKNLSWKAAPQKENQWVEIIEPGLMNIDRFMGDCINYTPIEVKEPVIEKKNNKNQKGKKAMGKKEPLNVVKSMNEGEVKEAISKAEENNKKEDKIAPSNKYIPSTFSKDNNLKSKESTDKEENEKDKEVSKEINKSSSPQTERNTTKSKTKKLKQQKIDQNSPPKQEKPKKGLIVELPAYELNDWEFEKARDSSEPENVVRLRKEREELLIKKERERKLQMASMKKQKVEENIEKQRVKQKPFDPRKLTFDSNGEVIKFKFIKIDKLMKDFLISKNSVEEVGDKEKQEGKKDKKSKKKVKIKPDNIKEEDLAIIKNPKDDENNDTENKVKNINAKNKEKIAPSGSNFKIILPSIGVIVKENTEKKEGGKDFSKYFNKYSLKDYDKILNEYVPFQNRTNMKNNFNLTENNLLIKDNNNNLTSRNFLTGKSLTSSNLEFNNTFNEQNKNNPLLSSTNPNFQLDGIKAKEKQFISNLNNNTVNNFNFPSMMSSLNYKNTILNQMQGNNSITLSKFGITSVKSEIDALNNLNDVEKNKNHSSLNSMKMIKNIMNQTSVQDNIFSKKNLKKSLGSITSRNIDRFRNNNLPNINKSILADFNKKIMNSEQWGSSSNNADVYKGYSGSLTGKHFTKQQALRELGSNMFNGIKVKLPRERKVDINIKSEE